MKLCVNINRRGRVAEKFLYVDVGEGGSWMENGEKVLKH